jgi:CheY-like chemotaxis protein
VVPYLCDRCAEIVRIDLILDEVESSTSASSFRQVRQGRTVLVADNSDAVREVAVGLLQEAGYDVLAADDGRTALAMTRDHHPDILVLGLILPRMTAFDLLRAIRRDERLARTPVLIMSGVHKPDMAKVLFDLGASGFIDKQRLVETLAFRVAHALEEAEESRKPEEPAPGN